MKFSHYFYSYPHQLLLDYKYPYYNCLTDWKIFSVRLRIFLFVDNTIAFYKDVPLWKQVGTIFRIFWISFFSFVWYLWNSVYISQTFFMSRRFVYDFVIMQIRKQSEIKMSCSFHFFKRKVKRELIDYQRNRFFVISFAHIYK